MKIDFKSVFNKVFRTSKWRILNRILLAVVLLLLSCFLFAEFLFGSLPTVEELKHPKLHLASELYSSEGELIGKYFRENRTPVSLGEVTPYFYKGLIATEDVRFYDHQGVDWESNVAILWYLAKGDKRGGSTITQQLAKNLFKMRKNAKLGILANIPGVKLIVIKFKEWVTASRLEKTYSKDEILLLYINTVDFGSHAFGIKAAAKTFFDKDPINLTISESAVLVGLLKATTYYSPILHPSHALSRRNVVLSQMLKYNVITQEQHDNGIDEKVQLNFHVENQLEGAANLYFRSAVAHELQEWCKQNDYDLYTDGLKIYTTIDTRLQKHAEEAVIEHMTSLQKKFYKHWGDDKPWIDGAKKEIPGFLNTHIKYTTAYKSLNEKFKGNKDSIDYHLNQPHAMTIFTVEGVKDTLLSSYDSLAHYKKLLHCGFVTVDPNNGHVKTWVGGVDYNHFQYDHVYQSKRQPGSTFKPFIYATAIENGAGPCDTRVDKYVHHTYEEDGVQKVWDPRNSDRTFSGDTMTLRLAMARSVNSIAAQLTLEVSPDSVALMAKKCGVKSYLKPVPSVGLGSNDVDLLELVSAYSPFINGGKSKAPILITKITDSEGNVLVEFESKSEQVISEETAWLMSYMLRGTAEEYRGTSQALFQYAGLFSKNNVGGKTGTSSNFSDGWYVGVTKDLIGGVWVGADDRCVHFKTSGMGEGMRTALPVFGLFMEKVYKDDSSSIKRSLFPKEPFAISRPHDCRTKVIFAVDSTTIDSLDVEPLDTAYTPRTAAHRVMFE